MKKIYVFILFILLVFTGVSQATITVTSPNGGENWAGGSSQNITWTGTSATGMFWLSYTTDNGTTLGFITVVSSSTFSFSWTVPSISTTNCRVIVSEDSTTAAPYDISNAPFTITSPTPVAGFTANTTSLCLYGSASFTDQSTNSPTSWSWNFGDGGTSTLQNPNHMYTTAGVYTVSLTATNSYGSDTKTMTNYITVNNGTNPYIHGTATYSGGNLQTGWVYAYDINSTDTNTIISPAGSDDILGGSYQVNLSYPGSFKLLFYIPDTTIYYGTVASTYYNGSLTWNNATIVTVGCGNAATINNLLSTISPLSGNATISGTVLDYSGARMGDPLPGVDISLEQNPGSNLKAVTTTDANGQYSFANVPVGNYAVIVNAPGNNLSGTHTVNITGAETVTNVDYAVDNNAIAPVNFAGIHTSIQNSMVKICPNPSNGKIIISTGEWAENTRLDVYNVTGKLIYSTIVVSNKAIDLSFLAEGMYLLKLNNGKETISNRIIIEK